MGDKVRPRNLIFAVLLFSAIIIGFTEFSSTLLNQYDIEVNESLSILDKSSEIEGLSSGIKERTEVTVTGIEPLDNFIVGTFSSIQFLFSVPDTIITFVSDVGNFLKLPGEILAIIGVVISLIIAFTVVEAITKGEV